MYKLSLHQYKSNKELIEHLIKIGVIKKKIVQDIMLSIDRKDFCPGNVDPYEDTPQRIGFNVTISAPHMHAYPLELLEDRLANAKRCLDVGSGTGYLTLAFRKLMKDPYAISVGVEHIPELVKSSIGNINKNHSEYIKSGQIVIKEGDGRLGLQEFAPYDVIHVGAGASQMPEELVKQLANNGRLVLPLGPFGYQQFVAIDKDKNGKVSQTNIMGVNYVPLTSKDSQLKGN